MNRAITISVQQKLFYLFTDRLKHEPQSKLYKMVFCNYLDESIIVHKGVYYLDRDPDSFKHVLDYIRGYPIPQLPQNLTQRLIVDAEYFELPNLLEQLNIEIDEEMSDTLKEFITQVLEYLSSRLDKGNLLANPAIVNLIIKKLSK